MTQVQPYLTSLQRSGLRLTKARQALLTTLSSFPHPCTLAELSAHTEVDLATIYRNIPVLLKAGVIEEITTEHGIYYALAHQDHHDHIVCTACGRIVHVSCTLSHTKKKIIHKAFASVTHHTVTYYGLCLSCAH